MMIVTIPSIWTSFQQTEILQYAHHVLFTVATTKSRVCDVKVAKAGYIHTSSAIKGKKKEKDTSDGVYLNPWVKYLSE